MDSMNEMRWLLLIIGIFIVLGIYLMDRLTTDKSESRLHEGQRKEPSINDKFPDSEYISDEELNSDAKEVSINIETCLLYTSPSPRDLSTARMPSSA